MLLYLFILLFISQAIAQPVLDGSWDNTNCPGCVCLPSDPERCGCYYLSSSNKCPKNQTYFYIQNFDPFNKLVGEISHPLNLTIPMTAIAQYSFIIYSGARFMICIENNTITRCEYARGGTSSIEMNVFPADLSIWFNFIIKPSTYSIWMITNLTWI